MRVRWICVVLVLIVVVGGIVGAQDANRTLTAYQDRFRDATPEIKLQILQTADALSVEELGPLYEQGVQFALSRADDLDSDVVLQDIALTSVRKIHEGLYVPAWHSLWMLFVENEDNTTRIAILNVFGEIGAGNAELLLDLNGWVQAQANLYRGGVQGDLQVLNAAVAALGGMGDVGSFPILLDVQLAHISRAVTATALASMKALSGDYLQLAIQSINRRTASNQLEALNYFLDDSDLEPEQRAAIANGVLAQAVRTSTRDTTEQQALRAVRYRATEELIEVPYGPAADSLIRHFNDTFRYYDRGVVARTWVLDVITALGRTSSSDAAQRLADFLDLLNLYTENARSYDTQITLAVVNSLGQLGELVAYDALLYVTLLDYPRRVKDAARAAMDAVSQ